MSRDAKSGSVLPFSLVLSEIRVLEPRCLPITALEGRDFLPSSPSGDFLSFPSLHRTYVGFAPLEPTGRPFQPHRLSLHPQDRFRLQGGAVDLFVKPVRLPSTPQTHHIASVLMYQIYFSSYFALWLKRESGEVHHLPRKYLCGMTRTSRAPFLESSCLTDNVSLHLSATETRRFHPQGLLPPRPIPSGSSLRPNPSLLRHLPLPSLRRCRSPLPQEHHHPNQHRSTSSFQLNIATVNLIVADLVMEVATILPQWVQKEGKMPVRPLFSTDQ